MKYLFPLLFISTFALAQVKKPLVGPAMQFVLSDKDHPKLVIKCGDAQGSWVLDYNKRQGTYQRPGAKKSVYAIKSVTLERIRDEAYVVIESQADQTKASGNLGLEGSIPTDGSSFKMKKFSAYESGETGDPRSSHVDLDCVVIKGLDHLKKMSPYEVEYYTEKVVVGEGPQTPTEVDNTTRGVHKEYDLGSGPITPEEYNKRYPSKSKKQ